MLFLRVLLFISASAASGSHLHSRAVVPKPHEKTVSLHPKKISAYHHKKRMHEHNSEYISRVKSKEKKHQIPPEEESVTPKNVIEGLQTDRYGHLSELLGIKGAFIPSSSHQNWLDDDSNSEQNEAIEDFPSKLDKVLSAAKGTLPLDVTPQQAAFVASRPRGNKQRQKFLNWEHKSGSIDLEHYPSTFIKAQDDADAPRGELRRFPHSRRLDYTTGPEKDEPAFSRMKSESSSPFNNKGTSKFPASYAANTVSNHYKELSAEGKKGFMDTMSDRVNAMDDTQAHIINHNRLHNFYDNKLQADNLPFNHDMIRHLQLDPAWDAMEAKLLAEQGHRIAPNALSDSKIDREIMPPEGEPVGQAYLPHVQQRLHHELLNDFHRTSEFDFEPLRSDLKTSAYYNHYQPMINHEPHTINVGGAIVHAIGDPWKTLKQSAYDHADDNFPVAEMNDLMGSMTSHAQSPDSADADNSANVNTANAPLKGDEQKIKVKEASKLVNHQNDKNEPNNNKQINRIANGGGTKVDKQLKRPISNRKGTKFAKEKDDDKGESKVKWRHGNKQKENKQSANNKEQEKMYAELEEGNENVNTKDKNTPEASNLQSNGNRQRMKGSKNALSAAQQSNNEKQWKFQVAESDLPREIQLDKELGLLQQNGGIQQIRSKQMQDGQQGYMEDGQHHEHFQSQKQPVNTNTGQYITHKFVNFLSDVANKLNVDKLSIAEQIVADVESSKHQNRPKSQFREPNIVEKTSTENNLYARNFQREGRNIIKSKIGKSYKNAAGNEVRRTINDQSLSSMSLDVFHIGRKKPEVIKYLWHKGISVLKEE